MEILVFHNREFPQRDIAHFVHDTRYEPKQPMQRINLQRLFSYWVSLAKPAVSRLDLYSRVPPRFSGQSIPLKALLGLPWLKEMLSLFR